MAQKRNGWLKYHGSSYGMPWLLDYEYIVDTAIEFPSVKAEFYLRDPADSAVFRRSFALLGRSRRLVGAPNG